MVMHPRPISETSRPWLPSFRFCIAAIPSIRGVGGATSKDPQSRRSAIAIASQERSYFLTRWPEEDFVYVYIFGLAHRKRDRAREGVRWHGDVCIEFLDSLSSARIGDAVWQFCRDRAGRDHGRADVVGFHFLAHPFRQRAHGMLGRGVNSEARSDLVSRD